MKYDDLLNDIDSLEEEEDVRMFNQSEEEDGKELEEQMQSNNIFLEDEPEKTIKRSKQEDYN